jgi:uncharacterized protein YndB with AHSA1/START domain
VKIDVTEQISAVRRTVGTRTLEAGEAHVVTISQSYASTVQDVWDACTNIERIPRWLMPISGDLRLGGRYQLEGNAGGEIVACERPSRFKVTWFYGDPATPADVSEVEVRLARVAAGRTRLELEHVADVPAEQWPQFGPGAVGVGWDGVVMGLGLHLAGGSIADPHAWMVSDEGREFYRRSSAGWGEAYRAAGASDEAVALAVANTNQFYAPEPEAVS